MKLRSRLEFFLAKIAGKDIDIATLVPPVASDTTEELLLAIANRLDEAEEATGTAPPAATVAKAGVVKMAVNVAEAAGDAPTAAEFKALIGALIAAGIMAAPAAPQA